MKPVNFLQIIKIATHAAHQQIEHTDAFRRLMSDQVCQSDVRLVEGIMTPMEGFTQQVLTEHRDSLLVSELALPALPLSETLKITHWPLDPCNEVTLIAVLYLHLGSSMGAMVVERHLKSHGLQSSYFQHMSSIQPHWFLFKPLANQLISDHRLSVDDIIEEVNWMFKWLTQRASEKVVRAVNHQQTTRIDITVNGA